MEFLNPLQWLLIVAWLVILVRNEFTIEAFNQAQKTAFENNWYVSGRPPWPPYSSILFDPFLWTVSRMKREILHHVATAKGVTYHE